MPSKSRSPSTDVRSRRDDSEDDRRERRRRERRDSRERRRRSRSRSGDRDRRRRDDDSRSKRRERSRNRSRSPKRSRRAASPVKEATPDPVEKKKEDPADILKTSEQYQRVNWERIEKRIHGEVNKVNVGNLVGVVRSLLQENILRGKGILCRSIMQAQAFSPGFTHVYAALIAMLNTLLPDIGLVLVHRLAYSFNRSLVHRDEATMMCVTKFIAHLINQRVLNCSIGKKLLPDLLEPGTDGSVGVAVEFLKACGPAVKQDSRAAFDYTVTHLRNIVKGGALHRGGSSFDKSALTDLKERTRVELQKLLLRVDENFAGFPTAPGPDSVRVQQRSFNVSLLDNLDPEFELDFFKLDLDYEKTEAEYEKIKSRIFADSRSWAALPGDGYSDDEIVFHEAAPKLLLPRDDPNVPGFPQLDGISINENGPRHQHLKVKSSTPSEGTLTLVCEVIEGVDCVNSF